MIYAITDIDEYINEHIKDIHMTHINVELIQAKLIPKYIIFFYIYSLMHEKK